MIPSVLTSIEKAQAEYQELVIQYRNIVEKEEISFRSVAMILDEIKCFWLERIKIIEYELEELSKNSTCFILCGAIYLNVSDYEQYYFKSMGDYHLLFDPFLKMETFFRTPENKIDIKESIGYFKKVYYDTLEILSNYKNYFYILPIREIAIENDDEHHELLNNFFLKFISSSFDKNFKSQEDFCKQFQSYEQIENAMVPYIRKNLIFNDQEDINLPLRDKIENYCKTQMSFSTLTRGQSESHIFLLSVYSWISQIIDILLICVYLRIYPYIRFNTTFHYLVMIMHSFIEDQYLREMIEKTIIFYVFYKTFEIEQFKKIDFSDYCMKIENKNVLNNILNRVRDQKIDIFQGGIKQIELIIEDEFKGMI